MKHVVDARLREEARAFALRFACDDCAFFDATSGACVHGYIERPSLTDLSPESREVSFCKEFELGARDAP